MVANNLGMLKPGGVLAGGKYKIVEEVGSGAMGTVYRAIHTVLDRHVAIKVLNPLLISVSNAKARFLREAKAASKIQHRNSVQILDYGSEGEWLYIVMEFLEGRELKDIIEQEAPLSSAKIADILAQVCSALAAAHDVGVIHRDLKPANIMVVSDRDDDGNQIQTVKVCDFGIAKVQTSSGENTSDDLELTATGMIAGTPAYMSPEQAKGKKLDPRSDLYACGVLMYIMATRQLPFTADSPLGYLTQHVSDAPPAPSKSNPHISKNLECIIQKCLEKDPKARYQSAQKLRQDLLAVAADRSPEERSIRIEQTKKADWTWGTGGLPLPDERETYQTTKTVRTESAPIAPSRRPWIVVGGVLLALILGSILFLSSRSSSTSEDEEVDTSLDMAESFPKKRRFPSHVQKSSKTSSSAAGSIGSDSDRKDIEGSGQSSLEDKDSKNVAKKGKPARDQLKPKTTSSDKNSQAADSEEAVSGESVEIPDDEVSEDKAGAKEEVDTDKKLGDTDLPDKERTETPIPEDESF